MPIKKQAFCSFCNEGFLHWEKLPEGWKLLTPEGNIHKCQTYENKNSKSDYYQQNYDNKYKKR